jgi:hypothetical protein
MTLQEAIQRTEETRYALRDKLPQIYMVAGMDALAFIRNRVIERGINDDDQAFSPYSDKELPAFFHYGRGYGSQVEAAVKALDKENGNKGVSYKKVREIANRRTDIKNFSFTQAMWNNISVRPIVRAGNTVIVIGPTNPDQIKKLEYVGIREKRQILRLTKDEQTFVFDNVEKKIMKIINEIWT